MSATPKPLVLIILDGFGHSDSPESNAIMAANTPVIDHLRATQPHGLISGSGMDVGLPDGQMGNSEVGHMNLGAGRVVYQDFTRVTKAIRDGEFFDNPAISGAVDRAVSAGKAVHILGLLSDGGVHSHQDHLVAMARDNRWDRVEQAYNLIVDGQGQFNAANALEGLQAAYARGENDEFVKATTLGQPVKVEDGDAVVFMNFRADRARELTRAFVEADFQDFPRVSLPQLASFVTLTQYAANIPAPSAFAPASLTNVLGEYLAKNGKTQLRIAETEKYAHVTFFFSGGREEPFEGEERILIPSPNVATYDLQPEMNAPQVTDRIVEAIEQQRYDVIIVNYANGDMVGHTGVFDAAVKAVECLDSCVGRIVAALDKVGGEALITADHGNVEQMEDVCTGQAHTAHTCEPVPFIYVGKRQLSMREGGVLADVAPTMLTLMGLPIPQEMTGTSIIQLD